MNELLEYSKLYPDLPFDIIMFFSKYDTQGGKLIPKKIIEFFQQYQKKFPDQKFPQPRVIAKICDILCENQMLSVINRNGVDGMYNSYFAVIRDQHVIEDPFQQFYFKKGLSFLIYGFKFIYEDYKKYVVPIEFTNRIGDKSIGTGFLYKNGLVTARHCIEGANKIAVQGVSKNLLAEAAFEVSSNTLLDLLFIRFKEPITETIMFSQPAEVLDEVMTLGYPKISGYHNFLAAENATVSSRYTTSVGQIAASAKDIWIKEKLFLITAKIKGGNSGGPVILKNGSVVGVSVNLSEGDGEYDNLGYGTVIPVKYVDELIDATTKYYLDINRIEFIDFE